MPEIVLSSRVHPLIKIGRALHDAKGRREHGLFLLEGPNAVGAALDASWPLRELFTLQGEVEFALRAHAQGVRVRRATRDCLAAMGETSSPTPVIAWGELPPPTDDFAFDQGLLLVLDGVADPGNVGTLWRAAHALGATGVLPLRGTADAWSPKVVRSAAGSLLALPPVALRDTSPANVSRLLREKRIPIVRADAHGGNDLARFAWPQGVALVLGHETRGVSPELIGQSLTIPLPGHAESLNVAMAGTILLWEWTRTAK